MAFSISEFSDHISRFGKQNPNKFLVDMTVPDILSKGIESGGNEIIDTFLNRSNKMIQMRAESATLPAFSFLTVQTNPLGIGAQIKQAVNMATVDCRVEFLADAQGYMEAYFNMWYNSIYNFADSSVSHIVPSYYANYRDDVVATINIYKFDDGGNLINNYTLMRAMPYIVGPVQLAWSQFNQMTKFMVQFHYTGFSID